jgi:hypothetical protein
MSYPPYAVWAANEIERLRAENAALRAENAALREQLRLCNIDQANAETENAALREDAERYRWLRDNARFHADYPAHLKSLVFKGVVRWETLDGAIDAARKE